MKKKRKARKQNLCFSGGGRISVSVQSIVDSPEVQRQAKAAKQIAQEAGRTAYSRGYEAGMRAARDTIDALLTPTRIRKYQPDMD